MSLQTQILLALVVSIITSLAIGGSRRRGEPTLPDFFYANHHLGASATSNLLLSSPFSVNGILYQAFLGYAIGWAAVFTQVAWCASYVWLNRYRERVRAEARLGTMHGALGARFGLGAERAAAIATIIGFTLQFGWEIVVGTAIFAKVAPNSPAAFWFIAIVLALVAAAYTMAGGLRGNARANTLQNAVAATALILLTLFLANWAGVHRGAAGPFDPGSLPRLVTNLGIGGLLTNLVFSLLWQFVDMSTWQNLAATESDYKTKQSLWWSTLLVFIFPGAIGTLIGMFVRALPNLDPNSILPAIVTLVSVHPLLNFFILAGIVCAMLSTIDGLLLAIAQAATFDLLHKGSITSVMEWYRDNREDTALTVSKRPASVVRTERAVFSSARLTILATATMGGAFILVLTQLFGINIFDLVYIVVVAQMVLFPVIWYSLRSNQVRRGGLASIVTGLGAGTVLVILGIALKRSELLQWIPLIALALSGLVLYARRIPV